MSSNASTSSTSTPPKPVLLEVPGSPRTTGHQLDGSGLTIAIISTRWYDKEIVHQLVQACKEELLSKGVASDHIKCLQVPGAYEMPFAASRMIHAKKHHLDAVICIGCMVKGATMAYEFVSEATTMGLMKLNVKTETPVVCGLLTCHSLDEAKQCAKSMGDCVVGSEESSKQATAKRCNHGVSWAQEAIELAQLKRATAQLIQQKCACACHCKKDNCNCACHCKQCKCRTCTCKEGTCACTSCFSHQEKRGQSTGSKSEMMARFDKVLGGSTGASGVGQSSCTDCGKVDNACVCKDCKCASCSAKKTKSGALHAKHAASACGGCQQPDCVDCGRSKKGVSTSASCGYHGRSSAPLKGEPNSETLP